MRVRKTCPLYKMEILEVDFIASLLGVQHQGPCINHSYAWKAVIMCKKLVLMLTTTEQYFLNLCSSVSGSYNEHNTDLRFRHPVLIVHQTHEINTLK